MDCVLLCGLSYNKGGYNMNTSWYDELEFEFNEDDISVKEYDITATPNDFNILTLFNLIDNGVIKMPPFQRNYVWDAKRASKLIESIVLGLPIPQVFLYEKGKNNFYVIDGQQRLLSIYFFIKQRFPTNEGRAALREYLTGDENIDNRVLANDKYFKNFSLRLPSQSISEKNKLDKLKYDTLGDLKHTFEYLRTVRSVMIKQNEPDDDSSIFEIFNRLNSGGQNLSSQEIRMSLYYSGLYKELISLNHNKEWRKLLGNDVEDLRFRDVEILVRVFAMLANHNKYKPSMTKFLNNFSKESSQFDEDTLEYFKNLFISFLKSCSSLKKGDLHSKRGKFSVSLFESIFVAVCYPFFEEKKLVVGKINKDSVKALKDNADFEGATQDSVASTSSVEIRLRKAKELIKLDKEEGE